MLGSAWSGSVGLRCAGSGVAGSIGRCEVRRVARDRMGGVGGAGARTGSIGWVRGVRLDRWVQVVDLYGDCYPIKNC
jgi:hypothetical protein